MAIRHRRNSLFYRTSRGALVGDVLMGLIHTAAQAGVDPFDYLNQLQRYQGQVAKSPECWLPWHYQATIESLEQAQAEPLAA